MTVFNPTTNKIITSATANLKDAARVDPRDYEALVLSNLGLFDVVIQNTTPTTGSRTKLWYHADVRAFKRYDPLNGNWFTLTPGQLALHVMHRVALAAQVDSVMETGDRVLFWDISVSDIKQITRENLRVQMGIDIATIPNLHAGDANKLVEASGVYAANAPVATSGSGSYSINLKAGRVFQRTMTGNTTVANPTNQVPGQTGILYFIQDGSGGRSLSFGNNWKIIGVPPTIATGANKVNVFSYYVREAGSISVIYLGPEA